MHVGSTGTDAAQADFGIGEIEAPELNRKQTAQREPERLGTFPVASSLTEDIRVPWSRTIR